MAVVTVALSTLPAAAWNCPVQIKSAEDAIKKAEAMKLSADAKAKIDHANAMWKARAAQAQAEAAAAISTP
jgi:hypothetical protein